MNARRKNLVTYGLIAAIAISLVLALAFLPDTSVEHGVPGRANTIGIIYIEGPFSGGHTSASVFGESLGSDTIMNLLRQAQDDPSIRGLVLRVNSPGGSPAAADEIAAQVRRFRQTGRKVVTSMSDVAASGAYWIACSTDRIWASQGTITGSIGAIWEITRLEDLYKKLGIEIEVIKSGPYKDIGSSSRGLDPEERRMLQEMVDDVQEQFVKVVAEGRHMSKEEVLPIADGRVFTGRQAKEIGLVDELGNLEDAIRGAARLAGIRSYRVREMGRASPLERLFGRLREETGTTNGRDLGLLGNRILDIVWFLRESARMPRNGP
jgi:protease-4